MGTGKCRYVACMCVFLLLGGCMSVPLRTMWDLRHFGPDDVVALKPAQLRVAAALDPGCRANAATLELRYKQAQAASWSNDEFQLQPAAMDQALARALDASEGLPTNWRLKPADVPRFLDARARLVALHEAREKVRFELTATASDIDCIPTTKRPTRLSIFLRLGTDKPYLVLFRHARLPKTTR